MEEAVLDYNAENNGDAAGDESEGNEKFEAPYNHKVIKHVSDDIKRVQKHNKSNHNHVFVIWPCQLPAQVEPC